MLGMRFTAFVYRALGRALCSLLLYPIVAYFYLTDRAGRRSARRYLARVARAGAPESALGRPGPARHPFRLYREFGIALLDHVGFCLGRSSDFAVEIRGMEHLDKLARDGRGGLVLGAHLGSFAAMRLIAQERSPIAVNVLMYTRHAARINSVLLRLSKHSGALGAVRVIPIEVDSLSHVLMARSAVQRGEVVAVLADRLHPHDVQRASAVELLGGCVELPAGPVLLGRALGCPVVTMFALRSGNARYTIHVDPFAERIALPRDGREAAIHAYCQQYAQRLERYCRLAPYQWFNFYDYWSEEAPRAAR